MTVRINKQKINLREKLTEFEDKVNFDEVVRGLGEYTGNIGVGATNPEYGKLVVQGDYSNRSSNCGLEINVADSYGVSLEAIERRIEGGNVSHKFSITAESVFLNSNVGIGTTTPAYKLDLAGNDSAYAVRLGSTGTNPYGVVIQYATGFSPTPHNYFIDCLIGSTKKFSVESNGTVRSNGIALTSDDRVKHNEEIITGAIDTIKKITPKKYIKTSEIYDHDHNFDLDSNGDPIDENGEPVPHTVEAGVIAQEVLGVDELKFAVSPETKDEDGNVTSPHGLNYNSLFTYAIAAIQEQQSIIEDLKSRIETLESK